MHTFFEVFSHNVFAKVVHITWVHDNYLQSIQTQKQLKKKVSYSFYTNAKKDYERIQN